MFKVTYYVMCVISESDKEDRYAAKRNKLSIVKLLYEFSCYPIAGI
jgi:hypothetical protein